MSKFISKKYRASFEDVTNEFEGVVKEETGLDVDTVINGLDNDIELMEAGKEYVNNKDIMTEALSVVDNLQDLKEANDKLIEIGEVTGDDVLASQEALMQAGALLGLEIQSISFESISIDPKQALILSNEGIIESIDKGIEAIIKFFKDLFGSIWKFITSLFSSSKQIELTNSSNIKKIETELTFDVNKHQVKIDELLKDFSGRTDDIMSGLNGKSVTITHVTDAEKQMNAYQAKHVRVDKQIKVREEALENAFVKFTDNKTKIGSYCKLFGYETVDFQNINKLIDTIESMSGSKKLEEFNKSFMLVCDSFSKHIDNKLHDDYNKYNESFVSYIEQAKPLGHVDHSVISNLDKNIMSKNSGKLGGVKSVKEGIDRNSIVSISSNVVNRATSPDKYIEDSFKLLSSIYYSLDCNPSSLRYMSEELDYSCKLFYLVNNPYILVDDISITGVEKLSKMNYALMGKVNLQDCKKLLERINGILSSIDNMNKDIYKYETFEKLFPTEAVRKNWSEAHEKWVTKQVRTAVNKVSRLNVQGIKNLIDFYKMLSVYCNAYIRLIEASKMVVEEITLDDLPSNF